MYPTRTHWAFLLSLSVVAILVSTCTNPSSDGGDAPAAPVGLSAAPSSLTSIQLTWSDASTDETGFYVERSINASEGYALIDTTAADTSGFEDTDLTTDETYYYRVAAFNDGGTSQYASASASPSTYRFVDSYPFHVTENFTGDAEARSAISSDGRYAAFSFDGAIVPADENFVADIYVIDCVAGTIELVSRNDTGNEGNGGCSRPAMTPDGRYVVFNSEASNLVDGDTNGEYDVFRFDRQTSTILRVNSDGSAYSGYYTEPYVSDDGRFVAYEPYDGAFSASVLWDIQEGTVTEVPGYILSGNGLFLGVTGDSLTGDDANGYDDIYRYRISDGTYEIASRMSDDTQPTDDAYCTGISADGDVLLWETDAGNLVASDGDGDRSDVFATVMSTGAVECVSMNNGGVPGDWADIGSTISGSGRYVVFHTFSDNLDPEAYAGHHAYVFDRMTDTIKQATGFDSFVSVSDSMSWPSLSSDGRYIGLLYENYDFIISESPLYE